MFTKGKYNMISELTSYNNNNKYAYHYIYIYIHAWTVVHFYFNCDWLLITFQCLYILSIIAMAITKYVSILFFCTLFMRSILSMRSILILLFCCWSTSWKLGYSNEDLQPVAFIYSFKTPGRITESTIPYFRKIIRKNN